MLEAIKYNLSHLSDFGGRQARPPFWYWVLAVAVLNIVATIVISIPMAMTAVDAAIQTGPGGDKAAIEAAVAQGISGQVGMLVWSSVAISALNAILLGAAFVRRLHDTGLSGWFALLPLGCLLASAMISVASIPETVAAMTQAVTASSADALEQSPQSGALQSLLGWMPLVLLIGFGVRKSQPETNRWGEPPAA